ncbi:MAG: ribonuclease P [Candidatus Nanohalarchaeota archaeon]|nr:MAG: ribonuclease P [Candidatus Nanohaloarchaeota archaeon]
MADTEKKPKFKKRRSSRKPTDQIQIATERIDILFEQAEAAFHSGHSLSDRYVEIARKISMKYNVPISQKYKKRFCKHCKKYLVYGANARVRLDSKGKCILITCENCGKKMRYGYNKLTTAKE